MQKNKKQKIKRRKKAERWENEHQCHCIQDCKQGNITDKQQSMVPHMVRLGLKSPQDLTKTHWVWTQSSLFISVSSSDYLPQTLEGGDGGWGPWMIGYSWPHLLSFKHLTVKECKMLSLVFGHKWSHKWVTFCSEMTPTTSTPSTSNKIPIDNFHIHAYIHTCIGTYIHTSPYTAGPHQK